MEMFNPSHPGLLIRESMGGQITVTSLAQHLGVTRAHLSNILNGKSSITALMSLKLDETFSTSPGFWMRVQIAYDLAQARRIKRKKIKPLRITELEEAA